jgi:hypothetical protein
LIRTHPHRPPIQRACRDFSACDTQAKADLLKADRLKGGGFRPGDGI